MSQRIPVVGEIYVEFGRKRVRSISGQPFPAGLNIECDRKERIKFNPGDRVRIKVSMSEKANGTQYLTAAKTAKLVPVCYIPSVIRFKRSAEGRRYV